MYLITIQLLNGVGLGLLYFMLAAGLTIVFGLMRFVNFAHGAFYMVAAYACFTMVQATGLFWIAMFVGPVAVALLALGAERLLLRHTYTMPHETQILLTFALAMLLQEMSTLIFGAFPLNVPVPDMLAMPVIFGTFIYPSYRLFIMAVAVLVILAMWIFFERTRFGALLRAGAENGEMVALLGVNVSKLFMFAFALGALLAAVAGVLIAPLRGVDPHMGVEALGIAFVVVVLGGIGSLFGALLGGLMIGIVQSMMSIYWPGGAQLMIYVAMAVVLLVRPAGLLGRA